MGKLTYIFFIIIVGYLLYSFIKSRAAGEKKKEVLTQAAEPEKKINPDEVSELERAAIAAAIAAVMGETPFVIKRVYAVASVDEGISNWRIAGRAEMMARKP